MPLGHGSKPPVTDLTVSPPEQRAAHDLAETPAPKKTAA
jgi:hypothetical protein